MFTDLKSIAHIIVDGVSVPAVCLVLEGGPGTLETVKSAIQSGTPAVIVDGSGRAADILAYAYNNSREEEVEVKDKLGRTYKQYVYFCLKIHSHVQFHACDFSYIRIKPA